MYIHMILYISVCIGLHMHRSSDICTHDSIHMYAHDSIHD